MKKNILTFLVILSTLSAFTQDLRTLDTKVADILARMPAYNSNELNRQMTQFAETGEKGWLKVFSMIHQPGEGDDTAARFLVESFSRYLSGIDEEEIRDRWEKSCISFIEKCGNDAVKSFFFAQLQTAGDAEAVAFAMKYANDPDLSEPALAVVAAAGKEMAGQMLADQLAKGEQANTVTILNIMASWGSPLAINEYISLSGSSDDNIRRAALNAMACAADPSAAKVLRAAAKKVDFEWDNTGATAAYLLFAKKAGLAGNIKTMEKICSEVIKKANPFNSANYICNALSVLAEVKAGESAADLVSQFGNPVKQVREHAVYLAGGLEGVQLTLEYVDAVDQLPDEYLPAVLSMLGSRKDDAASTLLEKMLGHHDMEVRMAAAGALTSLKGKNALDDLLAYLTVNENMEELENTFLQLSLMADHEVRDKLAEKYDDMSGLAKAFSLQFLAAGGNNKWFDLLGEAITSGGDMERNAALASLKNVADGKDLPALIELLEKTEDRAGIKQLQQAIVVAAKSARTEGIEEGMLSLALGKPALRDKIIPVYPAIGDRDDLERLSGLFTSSKGKTAEICFDALAAWHDISVIYKLYSICDGQDKTYFRPAFEAYVNKLKHTEISAEQRTLLLRKIMPLAESDEQRISVIEAFNGVHTLPALIFISRYLDNPRIAHIAASMVMNIALPSDGEDTGLYGDKVKEILKRAINLVEGPEKEYDREKISAYLESMPGDRGFVTMFNGVNLEGWQGLVENPVARAGMSSAELKRKQLVADKKMEDNWSVRDGAIWFSGKGANLCSVKEYRDFEMLVDWRITKEGDSGIYLRGTPQVQIWDTSRVEVGAQVGSGGLYNNAVNQSDPLMVADNPVGDWNSFRILMTGERVSVWLNGILVVDDVIMENYWDRSIPIFPSGPVELQAHGNELAFRDIYIREIDEEAYQLTPQEKSEGFVSLFNGRNLDNWVGNKCAYVVEDATITVRPDEGSGGNLYTEKEYSDFIFRFGFRLTPGANNGLGIRAPLEGDAAYLGMELQVLDNTADIYANLQPYQYHGSVYGVIPAKRGFLKPVGEWNTEEVIVKGTRVTVILNGEVIVDGDIADARDNGTMDHRDHPGLKNEKGHIGFLGHGSVVQFRNIRIKEL